MQKWTFANADPGFKTQDELSLQLFPGRLFDMAITYSQPSALSDGKHRPLRLLLETRMAVL